MKKHKLLIFSICLALSLSGGAVLADTNVKNGAHHNSEHGRKAYHHGFISEELLTLLKTDRTTLKEELKAGKSLADVASEKGIPKQQVVDLLVKQANEKIDSAVAQGKLTKEQALLIKPGMKDKISKHVELKGIYQKKHRQGGQHLEEAANILGMSKEDIITGLKSGKSLSEIAKEKGINEEKLINALVDKEKEHIRSWVNKKWTDD